MKTASLARPMSRDKSDTLLLLATCALVLTPHAGHLPLWIPLVCAVLLLWRGWITFRGERMPPRWLLLPTAAVAVACAYWTYQTIFGREVGVATLALLLSFKLLEMHAKRDLFVVLFLNFFLMLASFFHSQSIGSAALMILSVVAILTTQLSFQYTGAMPSLTQRFGLSVRIVALAIPVTLVLFFLFPRIQGPLWGLPNDANSGRTGLSDSMAPGHISKLVQSDDIVFRVKFIDPPPPRAKLYWRGIVLGDYDGRTWTRLRQRAEGKYEILVRPRGMPIRQQITLEPSGRPWLFALELPQAPPQLSGNAAMFSADLQLLARQPINERVRYDTISYIDFDLQPNATPADLSEWIALPAGYNPASRAFA
ncbi:MAG TPA: DUF3488 domain-containing protein, partial [Burkholderiaceae bacterium]|nr:DUF3488 domain-containing protein [Burkholderiaceae bacterium]